MGVAVFQTVCRLSVLSILLASAAGLALRGQSRTQPWGMDKEIRNRTGRTVGVKLFRLGWPLDAKSMKVRIYKTNQGPHGSQELRPTRYCSDGDDISEPRDFYLLEPNTNYSFRYEGNAGEASTAYLKIMVMGDKVSGVKNMYNQDACGTTKLVRAFEVATRDGKSLACTPESGGDAFTDGSTTFRIMNAVQAVNAGEFAIIQPPKQPDEAIKGSAPAQTQGKPRNP